MGVEGKQQGRDAQRREKGEGVRDKHRDAHEKRDTAPAGVRYVVSTQHHGRLWHPLAQVLVACGGQQGQQLHKIHHNQPVRHASACLRVEVRRGVNKQNITQWALRTHPIEATPGERQQAARAVTDGTGL